MMELHSTQNRNLLHRNNNPSITPTPPEDDLLNSAHYKEWRRILRKSTRLRDSLFKFFIQFLMYVGETTSLIFTLITGIILHTDNKEETLVAILLHVTTCAITVAVKYASETKSNRQNGSRLRFLALNILSFTKPARYANLFRLRNQRLRIIERESERGGGIITERGLVSLTNLCKGDLEDKRTELYEAFFQSIPMTLYQTYVLFHTHESFKLCNIEDLSRLSTIFFSLLQAAKAASLFESTKLDYQQTLHFLTYYRTKGNNPMVIYTNDMLSIGGLASTLCHLTTILTRFYTATFFMVTSPLLTLIYIASVYLLTLLLLKLYPQHLLEPLQNPPQGISTTPSYFAERFINIFANVSTRLNKFTNTPVICNTRFSLIFTQLIIHVIPLAIVYSTSHMFKFDSEGTPLPTPTPLETTINSTLSSCPELASIYMTNELTRRMGDYLFSSYRSAEDSFQTFNDLFKFVHLLWLCFYAQVVFTLVYGYADLMRRKKDPREVKKPGDEYFVDTYPILTAYSFYNCLLPRVISTGDIHLIRELMLLTVLKNKEFYDLVRCGCVCWRSCIPDYLVEKYYDKVVNRVPCPDNQVEMKINLCIASGHRFLNEFVQIRDLIYNSGEDQVGKLSDKKLFLEFFAYFDKRVSVMGSDRVERIFRLLGVKISGEVVEEE